jgi:hypothetical protein
MSAPLAAPMWMRLFPQLARIDSLEPEMAAI